MRLHHCISTIVWTGFFIGSVHAQPLKLTVDPVQRPIQLGITGNAGGQYILEQRSNLGSLNSWEFLLTLTLNGNSQTWIDSASTGVPYRFYRLRSLSEPTLLEPVFDFRLIDHEGKSRELNYDSTARAVVLIFVNGLSSLSPTTVSSIKTLRDSFGAQGTLFWMIDASDQGDRSSVAGLAKTMGIEWPVLQDRGQLVAREFGVAAVPEVVGISTTDWKIFYRGAIDDRPNTGSTAATQNYLAMALNNFLSSQVVAFSRTRAEGPAIPLSPAKSVSYGSEIAPLLQDKCVRCHSPGNIASWSMTNHAVVKSYATSIKRELLAGRMPPWHADPAYGAFTNDVSLKPAEASMLLQWISEGAPPGVGADPLADAFAKAPPPTDYPYVWPVELGQPDYVVSIPTQNIPSDGEVPYQYPQVMANVPSNVWLRAAVIIPGNARAVHHALVFTGSIVDIVRSGGGLGGFFASYVPGQRAVAFPQGTGKFLAKNTMITFQMHYTTTGYLETDQTKLGFYFMKSPPPLELQTRGAATIALVIPPGAQDYAQEAQFMPSPTKDVWLYELSPHMHYRGSRFKFEAVYPGGTSEVLLSVPKYDFHWQTLYRLAQPKRLPAGTIIRCRGAFDNSARNLDNPDPSATVRFGEQTDDEMFIGYLNYAEIR